MINVEYEIINSGIACSGELEAGLNTTAGVMGVSFSNDAIKSLGYNVLTDLVPVCRDADGNCFEPLWDGGTAFLAAPDIYQHVDFMAKCPFTITFDMKEKISFDKALVGSMYSTNGDYCLNEFELYSADDEGSLYNSENCIGKYSNEGVFSPENQDGSLVLFKYKENLHGRFFGLKVIKPNGGCDPIARIAKIVVTSAECEKQRTYLNKFGSNVAEKLPIEFVDTTGRSCCIWPAFGLLSYLNDGITFNDNRITRLIFADRTDAILRFGNQLTVDRAVIVAKGDIPEVELYAACSADKLYSSKISYTKRIEKSDGYSLHIFEFPTADAAYFNIRFMKPNDVMECDLSEIAVFSSAYIVSAESGEIINEDFIGNGANIVPFTMQPGNIKAGYNDELFEIDRIMTKKIRPCLIRMWMQVDWFEKEPYVYDFDSVEMAGVWKYLDLFKESGSEVQLTHSWKVGQAAQSWYSIPEVENLGFSAPKDLEHYAKSYSLLIQEIWRRGYDNVIHISFANEPGFHWDFLCPGNRKEYYCNTVRAVDAQFRKDGIREKTVFWCCESAESMEWLEYCKENIPDCVDYYTYHCYQCPDDKLEKEVFKKVRELNMQPFLITECAENESTMINPWNRSMAGLVIESANLGGSGCLNWTLHGIKTMSVYDEVTWTMDGAPHLWRNQIDGGMPALSFYNMGMFMRYIPKHSKVIKTETVGKNMRAATFLTKDGDITVIVECKEDSADRKITFKLPNVNKPFYRHSYVPAKITPTTSAILPVADKLFEAAESFSDKDIPNNYSVLVYSTITPITQIEIDVAKRKLNVGESIKINASVIDNDGGIIWSVIGDKGTVTQSGVYTAENVKAGDSVAVIATSEKDETAKGIVVFKIL